MSVGLPNHASEQMGVMAVTKERHHRQAKSKNKAHMSARGAKDERVTGSLAPVGFDPTTSWL
jgi:hypothetical protein